MTAPTSDLGNAAKQLLLAASALSHAAQEMADAAAALTLASSALPSQQKLGLNITYHSSDNESSPEPSPFQTRVKHTTTHEQATPPDNQNNIRKGRSPSPSLHNPLQPQFKPSPTPTDAVDSAEAPALPKDKNAIPASHTVRHRILVENETDVLPIACYFAQKHDFIVCYLPVTALVAALPLYQRLFSEFVVGPPVGTITTTKILSKVQQDVNAFIKANPKGILLLPESISPKIQVNKELNSIMIHLGWPSRYELYEAQINNQNLRSTILIAFTEDKDMYPAGEQIVSATEDWPNHQDIVKIELAKLRSYFQTKLSNIPTLKKERVYPEWISEHGSRGRRYVTGWSATTLVYRANLYLLDVLVYKNHSDGHSNSLDAHLPHVSAGFIDHNQLQSAVDDGVLNLRPDSVPSSGMYIPSDTIPLNDAAHTKQPPPQPPRWPALAHTYMILESDSDIIPLLLSLTSSKNSCKKIICFAREMMTVDFLRETLQEASSAPVLVALAQTPARLQTAADEFRSLERGLLFWNAATPLHSSLCNSTAHIDLTIHLGWLRDPDLRSNQTKTANSDIVLLSKSKHSPMHERDEILRVAGFSADPKSKEFNQRGESSELHEARTAWRKGLTETPVTKLNSAYTHWIMHHRNKESEFKTDVELIKGANHFARHVLLRGGNDKTYVEPPVGGYLGLSSGTINHLGLQEVQKTGLLHVAS